MTVVVKHKAIEINLLHVHAIWANAVQMIRIDCDGNAILLARCRDTQTILDLECNREHTYTEAKVLFLH